MCPNTVAVSRSIWLTPKSSTYRLLPSGLNLQSTGRSSPPAPGWYDAGPGCLLRRKGSIAPVFTSTRATWKPRVSCSSRVVLSGA